VDIFVGVVGVGIFVGVVRVESAVDGIAQSLIAVSETELLLRKGLSAEEELTDVGEGGGDLGLDEALGYGSEEITKGCVEIAGIEVVSVERLGDIFAGLLGSLTLAELDEVEEAEVVLGAGTRRGAAAAVGEGEGAQGGAVLGEFLGHRDLLMTN